MPLAKYNYDAQ